MAKYLSEKDIEDFFNNPKLNQLTTKCINCEKEFPIDAPGTKNRNHCPFCLYSQHVDETVGDRKSACLGKMKPMGYFERPNKEIVLIHKCEKCGKVSNNRIAGDDDFELVMKLPKSPEIG